MNIIVIFTYGKYNSVLLYKKIKNLYYLYKYRNYKLIPSIN